MFWTWDIEPPALILNAFQLKVAKRDSRFHRLNHVRKQGTPSTAHNCESQFFPNLRLPKPRMLKSNQNTFCFCFLIIFLPLSWTEHKIFLFVPKINDTSKIIKDFSKSPGVTTKSTTGKRRVVMHLHMALPKKEAHLSWVYSAVEMMLTCIKPIDMASPNQSSSTITPLRLKPSGRFHKPFVIWPFFLFCLGGCCAVFRERKPQCRGECNETRIKSKSSVLLSLHLLLGWVWRSVVAFSRGNLTPIQICVGAITSTGPVRLVLELFRFCRCELKKTGVGGRHTQRTVRKLQQIHPSSERCKHSSSCRSWSHPFTSRRPGLCTLFLALETNRFLE